MTESETAISGTKLLDAQAFIERSNRWNRVQFNGEFIADSKKTLLLRESSGRLAYYFPEEDVMMQYLETGRSASDGRQYYDVRVGDGVAKAAGWTYTDPPPALAGINGYFTFQWRKMDHWFEEEEEVFAHPRDPYHRVDILRSSRHIRIELDGVTLAETRRPTILFETSLPSRYYIPMEDVRMDLLEESRAKTTCPYKGEASYWSVTPARESYRNLVWVYNDPLPESARIKGMLCFYNEKIDLFVDGELQKRPATPWS